MAGDNVADAEASTWYQLPQDILNNVFQRLPTEELWVCRLVSSRWAIAAKATGNLIVTTAVPASEWESLPGYMSKLQQMHISQTGLTYYLRVTPPDPAGCAWLLRGLTTQRADLPKCKVLITLKDFKDAQHQADCLLSDLEDAVRDIAVAKVVLKMRGVEVLMQLRPFWKQGQYCNWHLPARLAVMAPVIDDVFVQNAMQDQPRYHNVEFIPAHLLPLVSAGRLRRLCTYSFPYVPVFAPLKSICSIANLTHLTSLQLANCSFLQLTELQHFRHLLELRLRFSRTYEHSKPTHNVDVHCAKTLGSCRYLRHVSLCAHAWSHATYRALSHLSSLSTLSISVDLLSRRSAEVVGCLTKPTSVSVALHMEVSPKALKALTLWPVRITCLELWHMTDRTVSCLHPMPHLVALKLGWPDFTGRLGYQPRLQYLTLTCGPHFDFSVDECRLRQFLDVLPALLTLEVKSEQDRSVYGPNGPHRTLFGMHLVRAALFLEMPRLLNATWCEAIELHI